MKSVAGVKSVVGVPWGGTSFGSGICVLAWKNRRLTLQETAKDPRKGLWNSRDKVIAHEMSAM